jgi:hypothetical protein
VATLFLPVFAGGFFLFRQPLKGVNHMVYGFSLSDLIQNLREEGLTNAQPYRVHHAISVGHIDKPKKDTAGRYVFTDDNMSQIRDYLQNTPPPGRKSLAQTTDV